MGCNGGSKHPRHTKHNLKGHRKTAKTVQVLSETITALAILIITFLETLRPQLQEIFQIGKNMAQAILIATGSISQNGLLKRISKTYRKIVQKVIKPTEDGQ